MRGLRSRLFAGTCGAILGGGLVAAGMALAGGPTAGGQTGPEAGVKVTLENARVAVKEIDLPPGAQRSARTRPTDELVLFCQEAHYQAIDARGHKEPRDRTPGTVVWHAKGEVAPTLVNTSTRPVHYFSITLK